VDLSAIAAALAEMRALPADGWDDAAAGGHKHSPDLERQLRQRGRELAAARARMAEMEAEAASLRARLNHGEKQSAITISSGRTPE